MRLKTSRGAYELTLAGERRERGALVVRVLLERVDGIEKLALQCRIADALLSAESRAAPDDAALNEIAVQLGPWIEREFETTREAALKTIRAERRLLELAFDSDHRGPF